MPRLSQRPRVRLAIERAARRALRSAGSSYRLALPATPHHPRGASQPEPRDFLRTLPARAPEREPGPVTQALLDRLDDADVAEIERRVAEIPDLQINYASAPTPAVREELRLIYGVLLGVPTVIEKTGLTGEQPPEDVHTMTRGPLAAAGGLYDADLIVEALAHAGVTLGEAGAVRSALDFGCSSARVARVLAAAHPEVCWHACDPNEPAIAWAKAHVPGVELFVSPQHPPLPLEDASLDLVYAISIWSHFAAPLALRWLAEMRRVIRPGGHLLLTTHGLAAVAHYAQRGLRTPAQSREIADALYREGFWYAPEFGEEGDWGVLDPEWGAAFLTPEWLLANLCPRWQVLEYAPGRNQGNQDVYVLRRV